MLTAERVDRYRHDGYLLPFPALQRHERNYRRYRENYAEQTEWHERRFAAICLNCFIQPKVPLILTLGGRIERAA